MPNDDLLPAGTIALWSYAFPGVDRQPCLVIGHDEGRYHIRFRPLHETIYADAWVGWALEPAPLSYIEEHLQYLVEERDRLGLPDQNNGEKGTNDER